MCDQDNGLGKFQVTGGLLKDWLVMVWLKVFQKYSLHVKPRNIQLYQEKGGSFKTLVRDLVVGVLAKHSPNESVRKYGHRDGQCHENRLSGYLWGGMVLRVGVWLLLKKTKKNRARSSKFLREREGCDLCDASTSQHLVTLIIRKRLSGYKSFSKKNWW